MRRAQQRCGHSQHVDYLAPLVEPNLRDLAQLPSLRVDQRMAAKVKSLLEQYKRVVIGSRDLKRIERVDSQGVGVERALAHRDLSVERPILSDRQTLLSTRDRGARQPNDSVKGFKTRFHVEECRFLAKPEF
jgi:hypothetical protein